MSQISAIDIKKLWYADPIDTALTAIELKKLVLGKTKDGEPTAKPTATEISNVHQDTWQIEESEASQDGYKNQLTGSTYRMGAKNMGDVTFGFTIGRYDFATKKALMGGTIFDDGKAWSRARGVVEIKKTLIALTEDDVYCVLPYANVNTREANTDGAVGLAVVATMLEPQNVAIMPEYWYEASVVEGATIPISQS